MIRVLIVDGNVRVRWGLRMRLAIEQDVAVVGDTGNIEEAITLTQALDPDVIVLDIGLQVADGANAIGLLRAMSPTAALVVLTLRGEAETRARAQQAGAQAFLEKRGEAAELLQTIREVAPCRPPEARRSAILPPATRGASVG